jgi:hypothetical protein
LIFTHSITLAFIVSSQTTLQILTVFLGHSHDHVHQRCQTKAQKTLDHHIPVLRHKACEILLQEKVQNHRPKCQEFIASFDIFDPDEFIQLQVDQIFGFPLFRLVHDHAADDIHRYLLLHYHPRQRLHFRQGWREEIQG